MKKSIKATALILAVTMTLTACRGEDPVQSIEREYTEYMSAEITEVEDKQYTVSGLKGVYTGDWKGNRPEGEGTFWINDDEYYYSTSWSNGYIEGEAEIKRLGGDGKLRQYTGVCSFNEPSGSGTMTVGAEGDESRTIIEGDFSDLKQLLFYTLDADGKLVDLGGFFNGDYESYIENSSVKGRDLLIDRPTAGGATYKSRSGNYIGQVNEKGQPHGYGYYEEAYELNPGIVEQLTSCTYHAYGSWKNGRLEGYFSDVLVGKGTITEYETGFFGQRKEKKYSIVNSTKRSGRAKSDNLVGNYRVSTTIESNPSRPDFDGVFITNMNYDTNQKMEEKHLPDGSTTYQSLHMISDTRADKGEFFKYNKDGVETIHRVMENGKWTDDLNLEKEWQARKNHLIEIGATALLIGGVIGFVYHCERSLSKDLEDTSKGIGKYFANYRAGNEAQLKHDRLLKDAKDALKAERWSDAEKKLEEAKEVMSPWWG